MDLYLSETPLCDGCFNRRVSAITGLPDLPDPPPAETIIGPDGRRHQMRYRLVCGPAGVEARAEEDTRNPNGGYEFLLLAEHDADRR